MTLSELGQQLKRSHPAYKAIPDADLGAALKKKHPDFFADTTDDLDANTIPETPRTIDIQLQQLAEGLRRVVFIAKGSKTQVNAGDYGMKKLSLPSGTYIYNPKLIKPQEIARAIQSDSLADILGSVDNGYGAPNKQDIQGEPSAVVARDPEGETAHSALTDEENLPETLAAAEPLRPDGGTISIESPEVEIRNRVRRGDKWPKPKGPVKLPK